MLQVVLDVRGHNSQQALQEGGPSPLLALNGSYSQMLVNRHGTSSALATRQAGTPKTTHQAPRPAWHLSLPCAVQERN